MSNFFMEIFAVLTIFSSIFVILSNNPVHNLLWLVLAFIMASLFLLTFNFEFLALVYMIVYVGAIAILFLFVIMMLNLKFNVNIAKKFNFIILFPVLVLLAILVQFYIISIKASWWDILFSITNSANEFSIVSSRIIFNVNDTITLSSSLLEVKFSEYIPTFHQVLYNYFYNNNMKWLGYTLYTNYYILFLVCGFVLLVGMLAAIIIVANRGEVLYWKTDEVQNKRITRNWVWQSY